MFESHAVRLWLALAQVLSISSRVLLVEKRDFLGGCHGVTRVHDGMMTEHGPRIYIDNFLMFTQLLNDMGVQFADLFVKYNFSTVSMMLEAVRVLSLREIATLGWSFITLNDSYKEITHLNLTKVREATTVRSSVAIIAAISIVSLVALKHFRKTKSK